MKDSSRREYRHWYRCQQAIWTSTGLLGGLCVIIGASLIAISVNNPHQRGWWWPSVLFLPAGAYLVIAGLRSGIGVGRDGVLVRSMFGPSRSIPWSGIKEFSVYRRTRNRPTTMIAVNYVENRKPLLVESCSLQPWWGEKSWTKINRRMSAMQNALQNALENARGGVPSP